MNDRTLHPSVIDLLRAAGETPARAPLIAPGFNAYAVLGINADRLKVATLFMTTGAA